MDCLVLKNTKNLDREEWLEARRYGLGGSDIGSICGLNKYKSPIAVYLDKVGELPSEEQQSEAAYWGTIIEDIIAKEFEVRTGKKVRRKNAILQHPKYPFMLANLDRVVVGEKAILECKTASAYLDSEWKNDKVPESYILQCQHYMAVTGYEKVYIAALIGGNKFVYKEILKDGELINYLIEIEKDFWKRVEDKNPPAMDGSEASSELLKKLYPGAVEGTEILLPYEASELIQKRNEVKVKIKELESEQSECENKLKNMLQSSEIGLIDNLKVTWKNVNANKFDSKSFEKDKPDLYKKYLKASNYRKFDVKEIGGK